MISVRDKDVASVVRGGCFALSLPSALRSTSSKMITLKMDDRFLAAYLFCGAMVMLKTWVMSFLTSRHRIGNKVRLCMKLE